MHINRCCKDVGRSIARKSKENKKRAVESMHANCMMTHELLRFMFLFYLPIFYYFLYYYFFYFSIVLLYRTKRYLKNLKSI